MRPNQGRPYDGPLKQTSIRQMLFDNVVQTASLTRERHHYETSPGGSGHILCGMGHPSANLRATTPNKYHHDAVQKPVWDADGFGNNVWEHNNVQEPIRNPNGLGHAIGKRNYHL
jgi:hypothetical protein